MSLSAARRSPSSPARLIAVALSVGLLVTMAACGSSTATGNGGLATAGSSATATPSTATPSTGGTPTTAATATTAPATHTYPSDYAGEILKAWAAHDTAYLKLLTSSATTTQLYGLGHPDMHWTSVGGDGAAGSSYQTYDNKNGDSIVIRTGNQATAAKQWHAGDVQTWDPITFPHDATAYAKAFMNAWINGNKIRMVRLSSQAVAQHFTALTTPDSSYTVGEAPGGNAAGHSYLEIKDAASSLDVVIVIANPVLGSAGALEDCNPTCS